MKIRQIFKDKPEAFKLFNEIKDYISSLGNVKIVPTKTQISFGVNRKFAWVWLPQTWVKAPEESITLTLALHEKLDSPKIKEVIQPYHNRFTHHIVITSANEFDEEVKSWLKQAYFCQRLNMSEGKS